MISHEYKPISHPERSEAGWQGDLGRLIHNAVVESSAKEEWTAEYQFL